MGFYAYLWLRVDDTPYYVGKGQSGRAFVFHGGLHPPKDRSRIIIMGRDSEAEAFITEIELIANWGRKDLGTGILHNWTDGGDGASGYRHSLEHRNWLKGNKHGLRMETYGSTTASIRRGA